MYDLLMLIYFCIRFMFIHFSGLSFRVDQVITPWKSDL